MKKYFSRQSILFILFFISKLIYSQNTEEKTYLRKFIYPLQSYEPEIGFKEDSLIFNKFFSDAKILGLGEASHGSSEIFKIKDKLTRYILQKNQGGIFSIEASMPDSFLINEYIIKGNKTGKEYLKNIKSWIYQTDEILKMIEWMKKYNDKNTNKIQFTGFDMTTYTGSIVQLKILMGKYDIPFEDLFELTKNLHEFSKLERNQISEKKQKSAEILIKLNNIKLFSSKISKQEDRIWFAQNIALIEQYLNLTYWERNKYMADNIFWLKTQYPESAFVLWAHNEHIKKTGEETGKFLKEKFKDNYINCGTFFYDGYHSIIDMNEKDVKPIYLKKNSKDSLEELLNSFDLPLFILDLKSIKKENNKLAKAILSKINYRTVGAAPVKRDFKSGNISEDFDYLIFIKNSTASKLLSD